MAKIKTAAEMEAADKKKKAAAKAAAEKKLSKKLAEEINEAQKDALKKEIKKGQIFLGGRFVDAE